MSFYLWAMRSAAVILFIYALLALAVTLAMQLDSFGRMGGAYGSGFAGSLGFRWIAAAMGALGAAAWPLFGAAVLWRIDIGLRRTIPVETEAGE